MSWRRAFLLSLVLWLASAGGARAEELETFCVDRPGLGTPDCTIDSGHAVVEFGLADWTHSSDDGVRDDSLVLGEFLLRYGLGDHLEAQLGWDGLGFDREHSAGATIHETGAGDLRFALRYGFGDPDALSAAVMPFVTLPIGDDPVGAGDWTAGLILPVEYALPHGIELDFTGEIDAAADAAGSGHHSAYSATIGLGLPVGEQLAAAVELQANFDEDPLDKSDQLLGGLSLAWTPSNAFQLDAGAVVGLGHHDPGVELYAGIARRF